MQRGMHWMCQGISRRRPLKREEIEEFLILCPQRLSMTVIAGPTIVKLAHGWSGIEIIAESHISVETRGRVVFADVFSCREFEREVVLGLAFECLHLKKTPKPDVIVTDRGWSLPP
jgi:S-adenosylmethionine/arginine decarboxylase-like enzyme